MKFPSRSQQKRKPAASLPRLTTKSSKKLWDWWTSLTRSSTCSLSTRTSTCSSMGRFSRWTQDIEDTGLPASWRTKPSSTWRNITSTSSTSSARVISPLASARNWISTKCSSFRSQTTSMLTAIRCYARRSRTLPHESSPRTSVSRFNHFMLSIIVNLLGGKIGCYVTFEVLKDRKNWDLNENLWNCFVIEIL